jgi:DNA polymerase III subunit delta
LLAAAQEIEKLYALHGPGNLGAKEINHAVADNSRYDVFKLTESALAADPGKIVKILPALRAEGIAPPVVLWALSREIRLVIAFKALPGEREVLLRKNGAWGERRALIERGAKRLGHDQLNRLLSLGAQADRQIKGQQIGDPWSTLFTMALGLASTNVLADTTSQFLGILPIEPNSQLT